MRYVGDPVMRALIFDLDGTLYNPLALRRLVLRDFARSGIRSPIHSWRAMRILRAYRRALETLRGSGFSPDLAARQLELAAEATGYSTTVVTSCIREWMEEVPYRHWSVCVPEIVPQVLELARSAGVRLAVCSDYPARRKLEAMRLDHYFDHVICAQDPEVGFLKPHPRVLEVALERLNTVASDAIYVGDRPDVDGGAAARAGMEYLYVAHSGSRGRAALATLAAKLQQSIRVV
jgi:HAD superfamily hydrolase (TIGR01509 family)